MFDSNCKPMQKTITFCLKFSVFVFLFSSFALSANDKKVTLCYESGEERKVDFSTTELEIIEAETAAVGANTQSAFAGSAGSLSGFSGWPWSPTNQVDGAPDGVGASAFMFTSFPNTLPLVAFDYGFNIPCNATITDLSLSVTRRNIGSGVIQDANITLRLPDFTLAPGNLAMPTDWVNSTTTWETVMYNDPSWGITLTPDILNDDSFGAVVIAENVNLVSGARPEIDAMELTVCYEVDGVEYQAIEYAVTKTNAMCGEANADITIDALNGSGAFEYSIDAGGTWQTSNTFSGLDVGPYLISVRNLDGTCTTSAINCNVGAGSTLLQPGDALVTCRPVNGEPATLIVERIQQFNTFFNSGLVGVDVSDIIEPHPYSWTSAELGGNVFAVDTDDDLNIYTATSSLFVFLQNSNAIVSRIDGQTGAVTQIATLPGNSGLAGIHYQEGCDQIFVANLDDGIIYRLDPVSGAILSTFDPLGADDGVLGKAPLGERILGLDYNYAEDKLYYSVWSNDEIDNGTRNSIRSISIDPTTCDFMPATDIKEFDLDFLSELCGDPDNMYSMPVADIEFSPDGQTMLLAEAGFDSTNSSNQAHEARVLEYNGSTGNWVIDSAPNGGTTNGCKYGVGSVTEQNNARGGIDFGNSGFADGCTVNEGDFAVFTADGIFGSNPADNLTYGLQYTSTDGGGPTTSVAMDIDRLNTSNVKSVYGDVDVVPGCYDMDPAACLEYDLAVTQSVTSTGPYFPGSTVTYEIVLENEGGITASGIEIADITPMDLMYVSSVSDPNVTDNGDGTFTVASLPGGGTQVITVTYMVSFGSTATSLTSNVQITADDGDDIDSDPATDETVDEDGDGNGDDDDEDPETIVIDHYDLAISKTLNSTAPFANGDVISFTIRVDNQGTVSANNIEVTENSPAALIYQSMTANANVVDNANGTFTITTIAAGGFEEIEVFFQIDPTTTDPSLTNIAEITADDGDDEDSNPDLGPSDDEDGDGDPFDDDEDFVEISIAPYDLSLVKNVSSAGPYGPGLPVTYQIVVSNDGSIAANGIEVTDSAPADLIYQGMTADANVTDNANGTFTIGTIPVGGSQIIEITYQISPTFTGSSLTNLAQITADDGNDGDSDPDQDETFDEDGDGDPFDDDEDEAEISLAPYDLSLVKNVTSAGPFGQGSTVTFEIVVSNDGSLPANGIEVTEAAPADLLYQGMTADANVTDNGNGTFTIGAIPAGGTQIIEVTYQISPTFTGTSLTNIAQITADDGLDADSNPDDDETVDEDGDGDPFDDDEDDEVVTVGQVYDLSLNKVLSTTGTIMPGSAVAFQITVSNDGTLPAAGIVVTDNAPADLIYQSMTTNANVTDNGDGTFTIASLASGSTETIELNYMLSSAFAGNSLSNIAQITADDGMDVDSNPDVDETMDEDGDGDPFDDDEDEAVVPVGQPYDLSLTKTNTTTGIVMPGDNVTFRISVSNDGGLPANGIVVTDAAPADLIYQSMSASANVTDNGDGTFTIATIPVGGSEDIDLTYQISSSFTGMTLTNLALITTDDGDDIDSNPDDDETVDEDGDGDPFDDDEDEAMVMIGQVYDLSLDKIYTTTGAVGPGSIVTFDIVVSNDGTLPASGIEVTDSSPADLIYQGMTANANVVDNGNGTFTIASIPVGTTETIAVSYQISPTFTGTSLSNLALITADDGDDIDSNPDDDETVDEDGDGDPFDDDEDESPFPVDQIYDLSLTKTYTTTGAVGPGSIVTFDITVSNDGALPAAGIVVTDDSPADLIYQSMVATANVTDNGNGTFTVASLPVGATETITVTYQISPTFTGASLSNLALITQDDGEDVDSSPDDDETVDEDGDGDPFDDDEDEATVPISLFDLALTLFVDSFVDTDMDGMISPGEDVQFGITITNQGNSDENNLEITDYIPMGMSLSTNDTNGWTGGPTGNITNTASVAAGMTTTVYVVLTIDNTFMGTMITNWAEISQDTGDDIDSTPDQVNNDPFGGTDIIDNSNGDEDDHDDAQIMVGQVYDLALTNSYVNYIDNDASGTLTAGDDVQYTIVVLNQGTVDANNIEVTKYLPSGTSLSPIDMNGWTVLPGGLLTNNIPTVPTSGSGVPIDVTIRIDPSFSSSTVLTWAEISQDDGPDEDSTPDQLNTDPFGGDDIVDNSNGDEDDHDPAESPAVMFPFTALGDFVWEDINGNGQQDAGEPGIENIQVSLYTAGGVLVDFVYTDASGAYQFDDVTPGQYIIHFDAPFEMDFTLPNSTNNNNNDSDVDNSNGYGTTAVFNVGQGSEDFSWDAGLHFCIPIGDLVWFDHNENDQWDPVENGINGMRVNLFRQGVNGDYYLWDYEHTGHKPGTPSDDGYFKFCAPPGTYYLEFVEPPTGLVAALPNVGSEENDSDVTGAFGPGTTNSFTVLSGEEVCDFGAGYHAMGTIGDFVFMDENQNGLREAAEPGLEDVIVQAYNQNGTLVGEAISDINGQYQIDYLQKTDVYLKFIAPSNYSATIPDAGAENMDSDVNHSNGFMTTNFYDIQSGEHQANVDAGFIVGTVPVEWLGLTVTGNNRSNLITWNLAMELNVSHYEVERSINNIATFEKIGEVLSLGDSFEETAYSFNDFDLEETGAYYYRAKQVDKNGEFSYSEIAVIEVKAETGKTLTAGIFPNPSNGQFALEVETGNEIDELNFEIYNSNGQLVRTKNQLGAGLETGKHIFIVDDLKLTPGVYNLKLTAGNNLIYKKLLIVRN